ncbi:hypothetical protein EJB05_45261 [Eragrostis curvula]|uniref:Uncharacterized protein n=1 Tax=Eragrostis curvula TaxID=38414 RepID=A0A5J9TK58_9POAL|nr:hypothetical protein EJB05_45261 [Eragrostis curvula]
MASPNSGIPIKIVASREYGDVPASAGAKSSYADDEMGLRIDELEQSINDLKAEMGSEGMTPPSKVKDEESKPADSSARKRALELQGSPTALLGDETQVVVKKSKGGQAKKGHNSSD